MGDDRLPLLWLCGPSGVGKSTVGWEVLAQLSGEGVTTAFLDADQIGLCHPLPEDAVHRLRARNLAALWRNFRQEGMRALVLAGFVDTEEEVRAYAGLLPDAAFTVCRLRVGTAELRRRFLARGWRPDLVEGAVAEAEGLDRSGFAGVCVDTGGLTVAQAARLVRQRTTGEPGVVPAGPRDLTSPAPAGPGPVLWVSGATAAGKSTVGYELFRQVCQSGVRAAYADVKQIAALRPAAGDGALKMRNLAAVWAGYRAEGARCLIVSGEADSDDTVRAYAELLPGAAPAVCRLHAGPAALAERVAARGRGGGPAIPGDELRGLGAADLDRVTERAVREAEALDRAGAGRWRVGTDGRSVEEIVAEIRERIGDWPG
ncbi:adenylyl-sulfate kinase [Nonomuraea sp. NPDC050643]|uniref:adenylyl-sulfate kinase n=1 Tax=Nonomuraea sp. NPDC050643 TaxID=3155660 RepID=UPI0033DCBCD4